MALLPLALPPGVMRNGTELQALGRWRDASLIRWAGGVLQPVGGWSERVALQTAPLRAFGSGFFGMGTFGGRTMGPPRAALAWQDLSGSRWLAVATYDQLLAITAGGTVNVITPGSLVSGQADATVNTGFGGGFFGTGFFGTPRENPGDYDEATTWSLDAWGEELIACSVADGRIFAWDLDTSAAAEVVPNAPTDCLGALVTDERFLVALGAGGNPRNIAWSDREDRETWAPTAENEAGDLDLKTAGQVMCGLRVPGRTLLLTDQDAHAMTYLGPPFVYGIERVGDACGVISRKAAAVADSRAFWMGARGFFQWTGQGVAPLPCEVADHLWGASESGFAGMNPAQASKVYAVANSQFGEVWWFYPSSAATENDRYVAYNYRENHWTIGVLSRTAGVDRGVFRRPIWLDADAVAYDHEGGLNYGGAEVYAESGPVQLGQGDQVMSVTALLPDEATQGDVEVTFATRFYPNQTQRTYGPYSVRADGPTCVRFTGRQAKMKVTGARLADWRWGVPRVEATGTSGR